MDQQETDRRSVVFEALARFGERYRADAEVRARIARGDVSDLGGLNLPPEMEFRVVEQTADTYYFPPITSRCRRRRARRCPTRRWIRSPAASDPTGAGRAAPASAGDEGAGFRLGPAGPRRADPGRAARALTTEGSDHEPARNRPALGAL